MATRKPISLVKAEDSQAQTWPDEPSRFTEDFVDPFILWCVKQGSSDISIQSDRPVYNEIHGVLYPGTFRKIDAADMAVFLHKIYGPEAQARLASGRAPPSCRHRSPSCRPRTRSTTFTLALTSGACARRATAAQL